MHSCHQPSFLLDADIVWSDADKEASPSIAEEAVLTIGEIAAKFAVTPRALRFYESRGLLHPRRNGRTRLYGRTECDRLALVLKGKRLGFTLAEISQMIAAEEGRASAHMLKLSREKCFEQITLLERQARDLEEALAELRRIHTMLSGQAGTRGAAED